MNLTPQWTEPPRWVIVSRRDIMTIRMPRRVKWLAQIEARYMRWRHPRLDVTIELNR